MSTQLNAASKLDPGEGLAASEGDAARERARPKTDPVHRLDPAGEEPSARLRAAIGKLSRRLRPTVAGSGLTPSQTAVLFAVVRLGRIGLRSLADAESLNPTMLSRVTAQLCDAGLIRRSSDPEDRRSAFVEPTAAGRRMRARIHRERTQALSAHVEQLGEAQLQALWRALPVLEELAERLPDGRP